MEKVNVSEKFDLFSYSRASCSMRMASHCTPAGLKRAIGVTATSFHEN
jgi:hypothetical protein